MGGYGSASGRVKGKCYYDSGGHKVTDPNAIAVAEYYISQGKYVVFLQEKPDQPRADLAVDMRVGSKVERIRIEVKGLQSMKPSTVDQKIRYAFDQIRYDVEKYPPEQRQKGKVIIYSRHDKNIPEKEVFQSMYEGFLMAKRKGGVTGKVELWLNGKIYKFN